MDPTHDAGRAELALLAKMAQVTSRRTFFTWAGVGIGVVAAGCSNDTNGPGDTVEFGTGDTAVLNYAYALEQLEAAFYSQVARTFYTSVSTDEKQILTDIRDHELAHRDFFKTVLGSSAIGDLEFDFSGVDFTSRTSVLATAAVFEDLGVAAYNGAGPLLVSPDSLVAAGSIVSVEARHAAVIRDLITPRSSTSFAAKGFAGDEIVNAQGLDGALAPSQVLVATGRYVTATINASNLP
ncbi:MAG: ferritin-like domain-containing protein [Gemmatimonadota bacterium]